MKNYKVLLVFTSFCFSLQSFAFENQKSVHLLFGTSSSSLNIKSDQFSADQPFSNGLGAQLGYVDFLKNGLLKTELNYIDLTTKHSTSLALSPSLVNLRQQMLQASIMATVHNIEVDQFLRIGLGYVFAKETGDQTLPNPLIVNSEVHAVELKTTYDIWKRNDLAITLGLNLSLPFRYTEFGFQSGSNLKALGLSTDINFQYYMTTQWSLLGKLQYSFKQTTADGAGSRGTLNVNETKQTFYLPIGFSYEF